MGEQLSLELEPTCACGRRLVEHIENYRKLCCMCILREGPPKGGEEPEAKRAHLKLWLSQIARVLIVLVGLSGCSALTDFERFHGPELGDGDQVDELERDAGELLGDSAAPPAARLLGTWNVYRKARNAHPCGFAPSISSVYVFTGSASALVLSVDGAETLLGSETASGTFTLQSPSHQLTGTVTGDGGELEAIEVNTAPQMGIECTVTRNVTGER